MKTCIVCEGTLSSLGSVPFDRNNAEVPIVNNTPVEYFRCTNCGAILAPELLTWTPEILGSKIYNADYVKYDPDYLYNRPYNYSNFFMGLVPYTKYGKFKHLDYGSGMGVMSSILRSKLWNSTSYDPYSEGSTTKPSGYFDLITAIEVVEHSLNVEETFKDMLKYLKPGGIIIFSTQLAKPEYTIDWWYIGARNGHINIQSEKSLKLIAKNCGMYFTSLSDNIHIFQKSRSDYKKLQLNIKI